MSLGKAGGVDTGMRPGVLSFLPGRRAKVNKQLRSLDNGGGHAAISKQLANVTSVHHCHTPVIEFQDDGHATGVWAMEDNLFWLRHGEKQWLRGFGYYQERYVKGADGQWRFSYRRLVRTHAETSPGAAMLAFDDSRENLEVGVG